MDFLNKFVLPQSAEHIELLHYMLIVVLFIFIPFVGIMFGGSVLSYIGLKRSHITDDKRYLQLSRDIIRIATFNKSAALIFGIIPLAAVMLIFAQILHSAEISIFRYFLWAFILTAISFMFIYIYRSFLNAENIFFRTGIAAAAGIVFLFLGLWLFTAGLTIPTLYSQWESTDFVKGLFLWQVISRLIYFILFAFTLAGGIVMFNLFEVGEADKSHNPEYKKFAGIQLVSITFLSAILIPVFVLINIVTMQSSSLSGGIFAYAVISLLLLFLGYHFLYLLRMKAKGTIAALLFFSIVFSLASNIVGEQKALKNATKVHSAVLSSEFEKYMSELKGENKPPEINAEEIYQIKCASCHRWDEKLVGPPHNEVIPKYVGREVQLVAFIRNPVKVNPDYPPMPNPGLKPAEAEAIARYLIETYSTNK